MSVADIEEILRWITLAAVTWTAIMLTLTWLRR